MIHHSCVSVDTNPNLKSWKSNVVFWLLSICYQNYRQLLIMRKLVFRHYWILSVVGSTSEYFIYLKQTNTVYACEMTITCIYKSYVIIYMLLFRFYPGFISIVKIELYMIWKQFYKFSFINYTIFFFNLGHKLQVHVFCSFWLLVIFYYFNACIYWNVANIW